MLSRNGRSLSLGHVGFSSVLLFVLYVVAMRTVFRYEMKHVGEFTEQEPDKYPQITLRQTVLRYLVAAAVVVGTEIRLPFVGRALAGQMGWNGSFVGTLFVAVVPPLPEMVVTAAAMRLAALDMAVGNVLSGNLFNTVIVAVDDLFYTDVPLLAHIDPSHVSLAFTAINNDRRGRGGFPVPPRPDPPYHRLGQHDPVWPSTYFVFPPFFTLCLRVSA